MIFLSFLMQPIVVIVSFLVGVVIAFNRASVQDSLKDIFNDSGGYILFCNTILDILFIFCVGLQDSEIDKVISFLKCQKWVAYILVFLSLYLCSLFILMLLCTLFEKVEERWEKSPPKWLFVLLRKKILGLFYSGIRSAFRIPPESVTVYRPEVEGEPFQRKFAIMPASANSIIGFVQAEKAQLYMWDGKRIASEEYSHLTLSHHKEHFDIVFSCSHLIVVCETDTVPLLMYSATLKDAMAVSKFLYDRQMAKNRISAIEKSAAALKQKSKMQHEIAVKNQEAIQENNKRLNQALDSLLRQHQATRDKTESEKLTEIETFKIEPPHLELLSFAETDTSGVESLHLEPPSN